MRWKRVIAFSVPLLMIAGGLVVWQAGVPRFGAKAAVNDKGPPLVPVTATTASTRDMPVYVEGLGSVQAFNTVAVKTRVDGQIVQVFFHEGQEVKAGEPLFQI